jgi:hypothetical protein
LDTGSFARNKREKEKRKMKENEKRSREKKKKTIRKQPRHPVGTDALRLNQRRVSRGAG